MSKSVPPTTNGIVSTEGSEKTRVAEDITRSTVYRAAKHWKKIAEISEKEEKRPPWRMVSQSTLPKADKNAILRAKLLDASRRMRLGKSGVACQTDNIPTKLMKEVNIDVQRDLIGTRDVEILTDGTITLKQEGPGEFVLTHSVAQMTDDIRASDAQTQTATPRTTNRFFEEYFARQPVLDENSDLNFSKNEKKLLLQIKEIKRIDQQLQGEKRNEDEKNESELSEDSLVDDESGSSVYLKRYLRKKSYKRPNNYIKQTIPSWHFDYSEEEEFALTTLPRKQYTEGNRPWSSFNDMVIGNKLANMKLSPVPARKATVKKKLVTWSDAQYNAVAELINEANALLNVFEEMSIMLGPDIQLNELPQKDETKIQFLSEYWEPILKESKDILDQKLSNLKNPTIKKVERISPEMLEKFIQ